MRVKHRLRIGIVNLLFQLLLSVRHSIAMSYYQYNLPANGVDILMAKNSICRYKVEIAGDIVKILRRQLLPLWVRMNI